MNQTTKDAVLTVPVELSGVAEVLEDGAGFWRTCSGCHETEDGHPVGHYPFSAILKCDLGAGCSECGGIGAVWDDTDYDAMAEAWHAEETAREQAEAAKDSAATTSEVAQAPKTISAQQALAAIDDFEIVGENNDSRDPTAEEKFVLREFVLQLFDQLAPTAEQAEAGSLTYPAEFTEDLQWILGLMCFQCIQYAQALRKGGRDISNKAEAEQAATLDFLLRHYMRNPEHWREAASRELRTMAALAATAPSTGERV